MMPFQSTPPMRRATMSRDMSSQEFQFQSTPPMRRATHLRVFVVLR